MKDEILLKEHRELITALSLLPEFSSSMIWHTEQAKELEIERNTWKCIGIRIDYLQMIQLGFCPTDPADAITEPILKEKLIVHSNYIFAMLQVVIQGFDVIRNRAQQEQREFPFANPRQVIAQICREDAQRKVKDITSPELNVGSSVSEIRDGQSFMNKFYRGKFLDQEKEEICKAFDDTGLLMGFVLASVYRGVKYRYLKKWESWNQLGRAHKDFYRYLKKSTTHTVKHNVGRAFWSDTCQPVNYLPDS
jgi:hypothetical protein